MLYKLVFCRSLGTQASSLHTQVSLVKLYPIYSALFQAHSPFVGMLPDPSFTEVKSMPLGLGLQNSGPSALVLKLLLALQDIFVLWHFQKRGQEQGKRNQHLFKVCILSPSNQALLTCFSYLDKIGWTFSVLIRDSKRTVR